MGDSATAMRDPVFYRWHAYIDDLFNLYKTKLPPYGRDRVSVFFIFFQRYSIKYIKFSKKYSMPKMLVKKFYRIFKTE